MKSEVGNRIDYANDILKNKRRNVGEVRVHYNLIKYKKMGEYKILEDISANVTLVQLMDSLGNAIMLSVLLETGYLTQTMKKHPSLIGNHWTLFVPHLLVKNKMLYLKMI